jgi:type II secretory pathway pseudopilin PulG
MNKRLKQKGFTLIETFVAISVLLTAIAGPLTIASKGLSSAMIARDQMTSFYLAQDAIEYIRHKKDTNTLGGNPWLTGLDACKDALCLVDSKEDSITACGGSCSPIRYDEESGFFTYSLLGEETNFTRTVTIRTLENNDYESSLEVTVAWNTVGGLTRTFTVREHIFDWQ